MDWYCEVGNWDECSRQSGADYASLGLGAGKRALALYQLIDLTNSLRQALPLREVIMFKYQP